MRGLAAGVVILAAVAVAGADEARYFLPTAVAARVEVGEHSGLWIGLEGVPGGVLATVTGAVQALASSPAYPLAHLDRCGDAGAMDVPASFAIPPGLALLRARPGSALAVTRAVVADVSERIALDENDGGPQDAASVQRRGRARCSGRANLAVGLLRSLGIPARVVHGMVIGRDGARYHRWGEAWLGVLGWVPFDPGAAVGLVGVRYVPLSGPGEGPALDAVRADAVDERGFVGLPVRRGLRMLPVGGATLRCSGPSSEASVTALLVGPDGSRWVREGRGEVVFPGMLPGRYRILWSSAGAGSLLDFVLRGAREVHVELGGNGVSRS